MVLGSSTYLGFARRWMVFLHLYSLGVYFLVPPAHLAPDSSSLHIPSHTVFPLGKQIEDNTTGPVSVRCPRCRLKEGHTSSGVIKEARKDLLMLTLLTSGRSNPSASVASLR